MNNCTSINTNQTLQGFYKVGVVNPDTDEVKWQSAEWSKNLILNQGMDGLYDRSLADSILYGISGYGTRPNSFSSGTSKVTQAGATLTLSDTSGDITDFTSSAGTYSSLAQLGDIVVYANNSRSQVTTVTDGFHLQVVPSYTFGTGQTFTVWKTSQTSLQTEVYRSNAYVGGAGNCGTTISSNNVTHLRTYDFPVQVSDTSYNELGLAWASSGAGTTFSRILLLSPVNVNTGFKLRLIYTLQASWFPTSSISSSASIGGWPVAPSVNTNGSQSLQVLSGLVSTVDVSTGNSANTSAVLEPYYISVGSGWYSMFASNNSSSLAAFGSAVDRRTSYAVAPAVGASKASYKNPVTDLTANGVYYCDRTSVLAIGAMSSNSIRSVGFGVSGLGGDSADSTHQAYCFLFNQPQTLYNTQVLSLTFRSSWSRILI